LRWWLVYGCISTVDNSTWCAAQWQAHISQMPTFEERKAALEEVPEEMRARVKSHLQTVAALRRKK